jgi:hypothetical protein
LTVLTGQRCTPLPYSYCVFFVTTNLDEVSVLKGGLKKLIIQLKCNEWFD